MAQKAGAGAEAHVARLQDETPLALCGGLRRLRSWLSFKRRPAHWTLIATRVEAIASRVEWVEAIAIWVEG